MATPSGRILAFCFIAGIGGAIYGGIQCVQGHTYSVAAKHEATIVGRVVGISGGRGGPNYNYVFSLNGVERNDYSNVCATALAAGACDNRGPVLVYYSFEPFPNSRLEDFAVASHNDFRIGIPVLVMGSLLLVLSCGGFAIHLRGSKGDSAWPVTEATIRSVREASGDSRCQVNVGDFTYVVNDDYFSGKLQVSRSFSTHGASLKDLVDQKIQVNYNPKKPEKYSVPQVEVGGFLVDPYDDAFE